MLPFLLLVSCLVTADLTSGHVIRGSKIVGGTEAVVGQFPYQVSIQFREDRFHFCGGSILTEKFILSAAHCFWNEDVVAEKLVIWAGGVDTTKPETGQSLLVDQIFMHDFDNATFVNDVAVVKLKGQLKFSDNVRAIEFYDGPSGTGTECTVSGWGRTNTIGGPGSDKLLFVNIVIVDHERCKKNYGEIKNPIVITERMICAAKPGKDSCAGDSGGPLMCNNKQLGVVSFGLEWCALGGYPGIYVDLRFYRDWIANIVNNN